MQEELDAGDAAGQVQILGVNETGQESGNAGMTTGRDLPWLQETAAMPVWGPWAVTWRDVIILDRSNRKVGVYNLTLHPLSDPTNYAELKAMLESAAAAR